MPVEIKELHIRVRVVDGQKESQKTGDSQFSSVKRKKMVENAFKEIEKVLEKKNDSGQH